MRRGGKAGAESLGDGESTLQGAVAVVGVASIGACSRSHEASRFGDTDDLVDGPVIVGLGDDLAVRGGEST